MWCTLFANLLVCLRHWASSKCTMGQAEAKVSSINDTRSSPVFTFLNAEFVTTNMTVTARRMSVTLNELPNFPTGGSFE